MRKEIFAIFKEQDISTHLVHVLRHNSYLHKDRGCLVLKTKDIENRLPISDVLAVIIAAKGVTIGQDAVSALLKQGAIILHCNESYRPIGKTIAFPHVVHSDLFENQIKLNIVNQQCIWNKILLGKINNQNNVLKLLGDGEQLLEYLPPKTLDEGNAARRYWKFYFKHFGRLSPKIRDRQGAEDPVNGMLNYGYAVLSAILHRSVVAHGLNPCLGIHHKYRFRSDPLVYDLFEPLRPIVDLCLVRFRKENTRIALTEWVRFAAKDFMTLKMLLNGGKKVRLFPAIDYYVESFCNALVCNNFENIFIPLIQGCIFEKE